MKALLLLPLAACVSAQLVAPYGAVTPYATAPVVAPWVPKSQYHSQDELGQVSFGHTTFDQSRSEVRLWNGQVLGHYSYIDANGEPAVTYYEAGPNGFRVLGANNLPEAPEANLVEPVNNLEAPVFDLKAPEPVQDTPEVAAARAEFEMLYAAAAAEAAPAAEAAAAAEEPVAEELAAAPADEPVAVEEPAPAEETAVAVAEDAPADDAAASRKKRQVFLHTGLPFTAHPTVLSTPIVKAATLKKVALPSPLVYSHLPFAPLVKAAEGEEELKVVSPFVHAPLLTYSAVKPVEIKPTLKSTGFPYIYEPVEAEASSSRRKRDLTLPLPYLHAVPTTTKATFKSAAYEPQEAATPADTTKIDLVTKEHEVDIPSVKYVQPVVKYEPITYKSVALPSVLPYASYPFIHSPFVTVKAE